MAFFIADEELKTLADLAHSCADASGPSSPNQDKPHKSLAEAAMAYQEEHLSPPKSQPARVAVVTGEEEERNVLQVSKWVSCGIKVNSMWHLRLVPCGPVASLKKHIEMLVRFLSKIPCFC